MVSVSTAVLKQVLCPVDEGGLLSPDLRNWLSHVVPCASEVAVWFLQYTGLCILLFIELHTLHCLSVFSSGRTISCLTASTFKVLKYTVFVKGPQDAQGTFVVLFIVVFLSCLLCIFL